jgi:hypothetical protein
MEETIVPKKPRRAGPKVIGLKALLAKKYDVMENLPEWMKRIFGDLVRNFIMIIWAQSASGKSSFVYQLVAVLMSYGNVLYVSLEEGTEMSAQLKALRHLNTDSHSGKIFFADHEMNYEHLVIHLKKKKSPQFIVIDSLQYFDMSYTKYKELKVLFPKKAFIFISHAKGKNPDTKTGIQIRFDAGIKVRIEGFVAFTMCRYGGEMPHVIYEGENAQKGAWGYWGKKKMNGFKK